ncbi:MAG: UDP-N-acetylmuramate:L-alanyl-gamma-D-glutamyl-meso-diaminopimelate ligase [Burkholderiales bacterium]|nr:UDP-N-acetylmuramate:L-alanyl-gamma-D-glutamyl-meso-diaminopimelate ligase [Burkholderiales bacterium]MCA3230194.1 UDP-N-acetylmuramate:L-alanyl-gamma-D-glutamyl-meso-diaminopimelate ligase [Burkholderiales bacterium]
MHLHILGICGTFMGGLAQLARCAGHRVTGCDAQVYPPMSEQLRAAGIDLIEGFDAQQLALAPDVFVVGNVVTRGNPLMEAILEAGAPFTSGPQWVGQHVLRGRWVLAVAGTHGKTTTSAMLAWILEHAGRAPGFLIGGVPQNFDVSARHGAGDCFVIEADEYDTAFFDKRSKFVHYFPRTAVLNNLEFDHADIFADLAAIETQFHHLVRCIARNGRVVVNGADAALGRVLARGLWAERVDFDAPAGWHALEVEEAEVQAFDVIRASERLGRCTLRLAGRHNRSNALAAIAAAEHAGVAPAQAIAALAQFEGVRRRLEVRGEAAGVTVYDDFAHHPTAIETTVAGLRAQVGAARILAVLEPRSNTMKLGAMNARLPGSLASADLVFGYGERTGRNALGWDLAQALAPLGARAQSFGEIDALVDAVAAAARPGDHVLVMSNGGFGGVHVRLLEALAAAAAAQAAP